MTVYVVCGRYVIISCLSKLAAPSSCMLTTINNEPGFSIQAVKYSSWFKFTVCTLVIYTSLCSASTLLAAGAIYILV